MEHAAARMASDVHEERRLPEAWINNGVVLRWTFIDKAISGLGKLALAWATIVLLGGFSTLIKQKDFLFVTIITFLEATRLFSSAVDPEDTFILNAPEVVAAETEKIEAMEHGRWQRHRTNPEQGTNQGTITSFLTSRHCCTCRVLFAKILSNGFTFAQFAAGFTSIVLAALRLSRQDYVDPADQGSSDHKSIRGSLNLFYGLVLAQGLASFLADTMIVADILQVLRLKMTYQLGSSGVQIIRRYMLDTYMKCSSGSVREAMNMDLVSFAMEMVRSNSVADRLVGVRILDRILGVEKYRGLALMRLRASSDTVANLISMLGLKNKTREEENTRGHAANVVLWLSPDLLVESFPAALEMISSLLELKTTTTMTMMMAQRNSQWSINMSIELTWLGVKILTKIMDNQDNCKKMTDADDQVMSSIVNLTVVSDDNNSISCSSVIEDIIVEAVRILHKLVRTTGDAGRTLRCKTSENLYVLWNIRKIIEHPKSPIPLLTEAIGVVSCLTLDDTGKEEIGRSSRIIKKLVSLFVSETPTGSDRVELPKSAVEALVMLAVDSPSIAWRILEELKPENIQQLVEMLSSDSTELRTMVAKLLGILRVNSNPEHAHYNRKIDSALPLLLKAIKLEVAKLEAPVSVGGLHAYDNFDEWRSKQGALLESIVDLNVLICQFIQASEFGDGLRNANLAADVFMKKLKRILDLYKSPSTDFPGIRRVTVQLIIWMVRSNRSCVEAFFQYQVDKAVKEVEETETRLEMFKMFCCGVGVVRHRDSISSLVGSAASAPASSGSTFQGEVSA